MASPAKTDQTIPLPDGRTLGYAEYGNPTGFPLLYFHGYPSSRLEPFGLEPIALRRDLRLIAPDRPGFGLSAPQPGRTIPDYPRDVEALADALNLDRFAVLGHSGGGPYALACAEAIPRRLVAVGVMSGAPPWDGAPGVRLPSEYLQPDMSLHRRILSTACTHVPIIPTILLDTLICILRPISRLDYITSRIDAWLEQQRKEQKKSNPDPMPIPAVRERAIRLVFEGFVQGSGAAVEEGRLLSHYWGIGLDKIQFPVKIWHGEKDSNAPIKMMRFLAEQMPNAKLKEYDATHYTLDRNLEEIFDDLCESISETKRDGT